MTKARQLSKLLGGSVPSALDTLNEIATALGNDASLATTLTNAIATKQNSLGYTPVNKAGDTMTGNLGLGATADTKLTIAGDTHQVGYQHMGGTAGTVNSWGSKHSTSNGDHTVNCRSVTFNGTGYGTGLFLLGDSKGLRTDGRLRVRRSEYAWYQFGGSLAGRYLHIKTSLWAGGSLYGNSYPTMSLFHAKGYTYDSQTIDSMVGFHNWSGSIYDLGASNAGQRAAAISPYVSSDGYVVLVFDISTNYPGITIDYHQAYPYNYQDVTVTAAIGSASASGVY